MRPSEEPTGGQGPRVISYNEPQGKGPGARANGADGSPFVRWNAKLLNFANPELLNFRASELPNFRIPEFPNSGTSELLDI